MFRHGWKLVVLICFAAVVFIWLVKASLIAGFISEKIDLPVTMRTISIWPRETNIHDFRIMNPPGYKASTAFKAKFTKIAYNSSKLFGNPVEINAITLDHVYLSIELPKANGSHNNWAAIGSRIPKERHEKEVIIHKLTLNDITVEIKGAGAKTLGVAGTQHFDQMQFDEINSKDGFPTKELVSQIFGKAGLIRYIEGLFNPTERIKNAINPFNIFGDAEEE